MTSLQGLVLAGGGGTRLWPLSRDEVPKQFLRLTGELTLFQITVRRLFPLCGDQIIVVSGERWDSQINYQASEVGLIGDILIVEPVGRNTAPAVALGLARLVEKGADDHTPIVLCPSDHVMDDEAAFYRAVQIGLKALHRGKLVTFGVVPDSPETGYGYIQSGDEHDGWRDVRRFVEKPDRKTAEVYLRQGTYLWNAGIFLFRLGDMIEAFREFLPSIFAAMEGGSKAVSDAFRDFPSLSLDYGVMEKATNVAVVPLDAGWSDLGSWDAVYDRSPKDAEGNAVMGDVLLQDSSGCLVRGDRRLVTLVGTHDLSVVDTADALYISPRGRSQDVREIVARLKKDERRELWQTPEAARRWGEYRILHEGDGVKVKRLTVFPGKSLSLQYHYHRTEHWVVVRGIAQVTRGEETLYLREGESTFIEKKQLHRLSNPGRIPLEVIEVQNGAYLGEDDIVRIDVHGDNVQ
ncbi:MAG: mannose-1-phosphate guanylyltransferase/mannose-6-phosphate isomerase [Dethiosulfovibrio peptidovorans]|nr:MAG: mannose-1-phosphate guanylyltransferase/mannose-6-phosphate isomerase [Dethiosulfovibrio peptidovorans]